MRNTLAYLGFIQEITTLPVFHSAWQAVYERLLHKGVQVPGDFEIYTIPLGITQPVATLYMMLCDKEGCGVTMGEIVPRLRCGGNGQCMLLGEVLGGCRHFAILVMASFWDRLPWMGNPECTAYKDSLLCNDTYTYQNMGGLATHGVHLLSDLVVKGFSDELSYATCTLPAVYEMSSAYACRTVLDDTDDIQRMKDVCLARTD
jgi:hypothetical protein